MTRLIPTVGALVLGLAASAASAVTIAGLYNTGVDALGVALAEDAIDTHYTFSVVSGTALGSGGSGNRGVVQKNGNAELYSWTPNNATAGNGGDWNDPLAGRYSRWLVPKAVSYGVFPTYDPTSAGTYNWTTTFNLSGFDLSTAAFSGRVGGDNSVKMYLNGSLIAQSPLDINGFNSYSFTDNNATVFSIAGGAGLLAGINTLRFEVKNEPNSSGNPTGLRTYFDSSVTAVPEPQTWALMGAGLALMALAARRRRTTQGL